MSSIRRPLHIPGRRLVLTKNMIMDAQENSKSAAEAARWLGVTYNTYKKWAQYYKIFEQHKNQSGVGIKKGWASYKIPLEDIFNGKKNPNYSFATLKRRLIDEGYAQEECSVCGFNEGRITDNKIPLHLDFVDGNSENKSLENMRLLCPNHFYIFNGYFPSSKQFCK
tara:strand:+ start:697 stop:1197 length:501 start_codon:yes stop_codon:yes gene_type:complete